jgi:hypothetical protein
MHAVHQVSLAEVELTGITGIGQAAHATASRCCWAAAVELGYVSSRSCHA